MHNLLRLIGRFRKDRRGNIAVIFAIACIPLISAVGCAVDYSMANRMKAKLQAAADGAAVAAISQRSLGYVAAAAMTGDGSVDPGVTDANNIFDGNMSNATGYQNLQRTSTVTKTGARLSANITYNADVPTTFMRVVGFNQLSLSGGSSASALLPQYLDFYLLLDVSGSMGLPSTADEQARLAAVNPDNYRDYPTGCTFACHLAPQGSCAAPTNPTQSYQSGYPTNGYCLGFLISRVSQAGYKSLLSTTTNYYPKKQQLPASIVSGTGFTGVGNTGLPNSLFLPTTKGGAGLTAVQNCPSPGTDACIQLRLDAVGYAVNDPQKGLLALARQKTVVTDQFRIGLYPFIQDIDKTYAPLTKTISVGSPLDIAANNLASELDTNANTKLGSGGTNIAKALQSMNTLITAVGTGTSTTNTQPYVFLVTDGAVDPQTKPIPGNFSGPPTNRATVIASPNSQINPGTSPCKALRDRGIKVSVLYIPYQAITNVNVNYAGNEDTYANNNIQYIPDSLQACASPPDAAGSYFYTANTPKDIQDSLTAMFNHALQTAHITN